MRTKHYSVIGFLFVLCAIFIVNPASAQDQTPVLNSIDLPFNIDGYVVRQDSNYGDWTKGSYSNGTDSGALLYDNGQPRPFPLTFHVFDSFNTAGSGTDDVFDGGNKADADPTTWGWKYGGVPNKDEMNNAAVHFSEVQDGDLWAVMSGDRYTTNGTSYIDFEFYQNRLTSVAPGGGGSNGYFTTNGPDCGRTVGDLLITVEYTSGGRVDSIYFYRWAADAGVSCGYTWEAFTIPAGNAFGYSNDTIVSVPYNGFNLNYYTIIQFIEVGINITEVVQGSIDADSCTGLYFETLFVKTKASASPTADLKDMIAPFQLELNLGEAEIEYGGPYCAGIGEITPTNNGPAVTSGGTYSISPTSSGVTINSSTGVIDISNSASGDYTIIYEYNPRQNCTKFDTTVVTVTAGFTANDQASGCDSVMVNGNWYYSTQTVVDSLTASNGCDSVVSTSVTIYESVSTELTASGCDSVEVNGNWYNSSQTVIDSFTTSNGCDSIEITEVTVYPSYEINNDAVTACDSAQVNGNWYTSSQTVIDSFTTDNGCDSVEITVVTINPSYEITNDAVTECDSAQVNGNWYTSSQTVIDSFTTDNGCDSVEITEVTIYPSYEITNDAVTACDSAQVNGNWYSSSQTVIDSFTTDNGCDSVEITEVTINPSYAITNDPASGCDSVMVNGNWYTTSQTVVDEFTTNEGCDSVETTVVTVYPSYDITKQALSGCDSVQVNGNWYYATQTVVD
ncbi:hypothetical protein GYB22_13260, partial [bacterium]|nr:hypothetical protein [bacterium]